MSVCLSCSLIHQLITDTTRHDLLVELLIADRELLRNQAGHRAAAPCPLMSDCGGMLTNGEGTSENPAGSHNTSSLYTCISMGMHSLTGDGVTV